MSKLLILMALVVVTWLSFTGDQIATSTGTQSFFRSVFVMALLSVLVLVVGGVVSGGFQ